MKDFKKLKVWEWAHTLTLSVYDLTQESPKLAQYGLAAQMRRASIAISNNIAEGCGRGQEPGDWFFHAALGSAASLEYLMLLAFELGLIRGDCYEWFKEMTAEVQKMLDAMLAKETTEPREPASLALVQ